ncbi:energy-coupling factor transporter transmembrane component T family protein [Paracoccus seriniphilus]|uniref:energy-coupling factor transporter transmembrane component T family protein n=1 Tax=Paracoccus seriniphilus TaxID=184748 RepID=UPI003561E5CF
MISLTSPVRTRAHDLPAALKLGLLLVATAILAMVSDLWFQLAACVGTLGLYLAPGLLFFRAGLSRLRVLWPFVVMILIWHLVTRDLDQGLVIVLRMISAVGLANLVTMTTRLTDMMAVIRRIVRPLTRLGLNMKALEIGVALVIRMVPVLSDKGHQLTESWAARSPRRARWRVIAPLALLALEDADNVGTALRARGGLGNLEKE